MNITLSDIIKVKDILGMQDWKSGLKNILLELKDNQLNGDESLVTRIIAIEVALENNRFCLGEAPFEGEQGIKAAKVILQFLHILHVKDLNIQSDTAKAVENMLSHNFKDLYYSTIRMQEIKYKFSEKEIYESSIVKKIINNAQITDSLIKEGIEEVVNEISKSQENNTDVFHVISNHYNHYKLINVDTLKVVFPLLKFIYYLFKFSEAFYESDAVQLSIVFDNKESALNYIEKYAYFKNANQFVEGLFSMDDFKMSILNLPKDKLSIWRKFNNDLDREWVRFFLKADIVDKHCGSSSYLQVDSVQEALKIVKANTSSVWKLGYCFDFHLEKKEEISLDSKDYEKDIDYFKALCEKVSAIIKNDKLTYMPGCLEEINAPINSVLGKALEGRKNKDNMPDIREEIDGFKISKLPAGDIKTIFIDQLIGFDVLYSDDLKDSVKSGMMKNVLKSEDTCFYLVKKAEQIVAAIYCWKGWYSDWSASSSTKESSLVIGSCIAKQEFKAAYIKIFITSLSKNFNDSDFDRFFINPDFCYNKFKSFQNSCKGFNKLSVKDDSLINPNKHLLIDLRNVNKTLANINDKFTKQIQDFTSYKSLHKGFLLTWYKSEFCSDDGEEKKVVDKSFFVEEIQPNLAKIYKYYLKTNATITSIKDAFLDQVLPLDIYKSSFEELPNIVPDPLVPNAGMIVMTGSLQCQIFERQEVLVIGRLGIENKEELDVVGDA